MNYEKAKVEYEEDTQQLKMCYRFTPFQSCVLDLWIFGRLRGEVALSPGKRFEEWFDHDRVPFKVVLDDGDN